MIFAIGLPLTLVTMIFAHVAMLAASGFMTSVASARITSKAGHVSAFQPDEDIITAGVGAAKA